MSEVFYLRPIDPPIVPADVQTMAKHAGGCFDLHGVDWKQSFLAADGGRMLCWYRAPDAESARIALRQLGSDMSAVWAGAVVGDDPSSSASNVGSAAEIRLDEPMAEAALERRIDTLRQSAAALVTGFVSARGTQLVCLFEADDVAVVQDALREAGLTAQRVWPCVSVTPYQ
ncbi:MAG: DUF4242 domain-containing protein [Gammaproteobacteria bacterium]|nr:DUF4242 domain-containing protein [Gammaproteobacteria bacterium]